MHPGCLQKSLRNKDLQPEGDSPAAGARGGGCTLAHAASRALGVPPRHSPAPGDRGEPGLLELPCVELKAEYNILCTKAAYLD